MGRELYPALCAAQTWRLDAGELHRIYVEESGNPAGIPVIFLHGGPGSGCNENHRRYFNPDKYRIIIFDQRGCHRSTPQGECQENTSQDLIADMERIRRELRIDKWLLFGGSWGAALALLYAQTHPQHVSGLILRGTFLARQQDLDWFIKRGASHIFPDFWEDFISIIPAAERDDLIAAYHRRMHGDDKHTQQQAAASWAAWAMRTVTWMLADREINSAAPEDITTQVHEVKIETHYAKHRYFLAPDQLLRHSDYLPDVPAIIIHGRKDMTCLPEAAWSLHKKLPGSSLRIIKDGGHLAGEPAMVDALITATDEMAAVLHHA